MIGREVRQGWGRWGFREWWVEVLALHYEDNFMVSKCLIAMRKNFTCLEKSCRISGLLKSAEIKDLQIHLFPLFFPFYFSSFLPPPPPPTSKKKVQGNLAYDKLTKELFFDFSHVAFTCRFWSFILGNKRLCGAKYFLKNRGEDEGTDL